MSPDAALDDPQDDAHPSLLLLERFQWFLWARQGDLTWAEVIDQAEELCLSALKSGDCLAVSVAVDILVTCADIFIREECPKGPGYDLVASGLRSARSLCQMLKFEDRMADPLLQHLQTQLREAGVQCRVAERIFSEEQAAADRRSRGGRARAEKAVAQSDWLTAVLDEAYSELQADGHQSPGRVLLEKKAFALLMDDPRRHEIREKAIRRYLEFRKTN